MIASSKVAGRCKVTSVFNRLVNPVINSCTC
uniref:Uncharacterized protein n=1 Tax=Arundo donax TaxID=35708 RepID=A0A0A9BAB5_ARUDO